MRDDFCAFILTHGRPDKVLTYRTLRRAGYTGKIFIVVDDEDKTRHWCSYALGCDWLTWTHHHR
ncbi:hypothetical protein FC325_12155 [Escherichia coli]|nr:hypothetical protein [Escherichia coli]QLE21876.1 hypothetical protein FC325_12155 [Escherichia coli]